MTEKEIDKRWSDHLASLESWGGEFDKAGVLEAWALELREFHESQQR